LIERCSKLGSRRTKKAPLYVRASKKKKKDGGANSGAPGAKKAPHPPIVGWEGEERRERKAASSFLKGGRGEGLFALSETKEKRKDR